MSALLVEQPDEIAYIKLNRPDVRNAFDDALISELTEAFSEVQARAVVLSGEGKLFCSGGDIRWMGDSIRLSEEENFAEAKKLAAMFQAIDDCPCPVIGKIHRAAFGGGAGLVCVCDIVVAAEGTIFSFSEVKLGLSPSIIAPFAIRKIGLSAARRYFLTAETFDAEEAKRIGLVHEVIRFHHLDNKVEEIIASIKEAGPNAVREAKYLIHRLSDLAPEQALTICAQTIARLRVSDEGQEGVKAFLEKRSPWWVED